jgi:hypothetical protein
VHDDRARACSRSACATKEEMMALPGANAGLVFSMLELMHRSLKIGRHKKQSHVETIEE